MQLKRYTIGFVLLLSLAACETVVDIDLPEGQSKLTLNALFGPDSIMNVSLYPSKEALESGNYLAIENATITVSGTDGQVATTNKLGIDVFTLESVYKLAIKAKAGVVYTITASAEGYAPVVSVTSIPEPVDIVRVDTGTVFTDGYEEGQLSITLTDPSRIGNLYELKFYVLIYYPDTLDGKLIYYPTTQEVYAYSRNNDFFNSDYSSELIFTDELFDGKTYTALVNYYNEFKDDGGDSTQITDYLSSYLVTELRSLSTDYFAFKSSYSRYQFSTGDPFAQPVQVYDNIDGGFGIFAGFNSTHDTLQLTQGIFPSPLD